jgi:two-component system sensor histidine kinase KdpD
MTLGKKKFEFGLLLLDLRELALRRTAERVDEQMLSYRTGKGVKAVWPATERIMVGVSPNRRSIRLIRAAKRMAAGFRADWLAYPRVSLPFFPTCSV